MRNIGKIIESKLQVLDMTQSQLGEQLGLNQRTVSQYVRGHSMPSLETLVNICNILEIDISYILEIEHYNNTEFLLEDKDEVCLINNFRNVSSHDKRTLIALSDILVREKQ